MKNVEKRRFASKLLSFIEQGDILIHVVRPELELLGLFDVQIQGFDFSRSPVAHHRGLSGQDLKLLKKLTSRNAIGTETFQVARFLLAVDEFEVVLLQKLM